MFYYLIKHFIGDSTFSAITVRSLLTLLTSFMIVIILTPSIIRRMRRRNLSQPIRECGPKTHLESKKGTPSMGGIGINIAVMLSCLFWSNLNKMVLALFIIYIPLAILGLSDDLMKFFHGSSAGVKARTKLLFQIAISLIFVNYIMRAGILNPTLYIPVLGRELMLGWLYFPFVVLVITGSANAVNLTDGLDGLAMGCSSIVALSYGIVAYLTGNAIYSNYLEVPHIKLAGELLIPACAILGAGFGFLWYNSYPAQIFMGDTGSLPLGGAIGGLAVLVKGELLLVLIGGIFVLEAVSVIIQVTSFRLRKKKVFLMTPLHHHFELSGIAEPKIVFRFWMITAILVMMGFCIIGLNILGL
ncbi:MAG: phospho-N-acetylmuramoyl-pentapeptide-transferase [Candidatus Wallbacteria bacterium]|nr:phospho-N-acetylmuramoyl-pentapeptide-transferase [Candidatus Wallbacteria bacterium]